MKTRAFKITKIFAVLIIILLSHTSCFEFGNSGSSLNASGSHAQGVSNPSDQGDSINISDLPSSGNFEGDAGGTFSMPVTISKLIKNHPNALFLSSSINKVEGHENQVVITGSAGAADPEREIAFTQQGSNEIITTVTPNADGSFVVALDGAYQSQPINIAYHAATAEGEEWGIPVTAVTDSENSFKIMIHDVAAFINEDVTISKNNVIFNYKQADGSYAIKYQSLTGGEIHLFANVNQYLVNMKSTAHLNLYEKDKYSRSILSKSIFGVNPTLQALVRVSADGDIFTLSDIINGDTDPYLNLTRDIKSLSYELSPSSTFAMVHLISKTEGVYHPFYQIPLTSVDETIKDDLTVTFPEVHPALKLEFVYDNMQNLVSIGQYQFIDESNQPVEGKYEYFMKYVSLPYRYSSYDLSDYQKANLEGKNVASSSYVHILETLMPISSPVIRFWPNQEFTMKPKFTWYMECTEEAQEQICHYDKVSDTNPIPITIGSQPKHKPTINSDSQFIAYKVTNDDKSTDIYVKDINSGTVIPITRDSEISENLGHYRYNDRATFGNDYTLFFLTSKDGINYYPAVSALKNHKVAGQYIKGSIHCKVENFALEDPETACMSPEQKRRHDLKDKEICITALFSDFLADPIYDEDIEICINYLEYEAAKTDNTKVCKDYDLNESDSGIINACIQPQLVSDASRDRNESEYCLTSDDLIPTETQLCFDAKTWADNMDTIVSGSGGEAILLGGKLPAIRRIK